MDLCHVIYSGRSTQVQARLHLSGQRVKNIRRYLLNLQVVTLRMGSSKRQNDSDQTEENIEETKNEGQRLWQVPS